MEPSHFDERVRQLCARAVTAKEEEVEGVFIELRAVLQEHAQFVREMATRVLSRSPSSSNAADHFPRDAHPDFSRDPAASGMQ